MARFRMLGTVLAACLMAGGVGFAQEKAADAAASPAANPSTDAKPMVAAADAADATTGGAGAAKDATVTSGQAAGQATAQAGDKDAVDKDSADSDKADAADGSADGAGKADAGKGKKKKKKKVKPPKLVPVSIVNGTLTMDGATGKALLNYDIPDLHYLYIWAPGIGTVVISNKQFAGAAEQKKAFAQNTVDVLVDDHKLEIYSDQPLFDKKKDKDEAKLVQEQLMSAWVRVDAGFVLPTRYPAMGFGMTADAPYAWPGSKPEAKRTRGVVTPPPMPEWIRPVLVGQENKGPAAGAGKAAEATVTPKTPPAPASPGIDPNAVAEQTPAGTQPAGSQQAADTVTAAPADKTGSQQTAQSQ